jgi:DNA recombination protein RmuC
MEFAAYASLAFALAAVLLCVLILWRVGGPARVPEELSTRIAVLEQVARSLPETLRDELRGGRDELRGMFAGQTEALETRFSAVDSRLVEFGKAQTDQLAGMRKEAADGREKLEEAIRRDAEGFATAQSERLKETNDGVQSLSDRLLAAQREGRDEQRVALEGVTGKVGQLIEANDKRQEALRETVAGGLEKMRVDNATSSRR